MRIAVLAGDGVGPEITAEALKALRAVEGRFGLSFERHELPVGWAAVDALGEVLPESVRQACLASDAIFLGAVGLPDRDATLPQEQRPERAALLRLREGNWANLRPIWLPACMARPGRPAVDILIVRELGGGIYTGQPRGRREAGGVAEAFDTMRYSVPEIERVARLAFQAARTRRGAVCSIDKANILSVSALWRETVDALAGDYPDVALRHQLVDSAAPVLIQHPERFDVVLTGNLFGDILSDLCGVLAGSLGMLPSASVGGTVPLFEPAHGSAPDIMGRDLANPVAAILTMEMLLRQAFGLEEPARAIRRAVLEVLQAGYRTADVLDPGSTQVSCSRFGDLVAQRIQASG